MIMLTGHADKDHVMAARDAGVHEFLAKPVSPRNVYGRLLSVLNSNRPFVRNDDYFGPDRRRREVLFEGQSKRKIDAEATADHREPPAPVQRASGAGEG